MIKLQPKPLLIGGAAKVDQVEAGAIKMLQPLSLRFSQLAKEMQVPGMKALPRMSQVGGVNQRTLGMLAVLLGINLLLVIEMVKMTVGINQNLLATMEVLGKKNGDRVMKPVIMVTNGRVQGLMVEKNGAVMKQNPRVEAVGIHPSHLMLFLLVGKINPTPQV